MAALFPTPGTLLAVLPPCEPRPELAAGLARFRPLSLAELEAVALLSRRDTKFVLGEEQLLALLSRLDGGYRVLEASGARVHSYRTVYFDTDGFDLFSAHHNARPRRFKVRSRLYVESGTAVFEVKARNGRDDTVKVRTGTRGIVTEVSSREAAFLEAHAPSVAGGLSPSLVSSFSRVTFASLEHDERLTFDFGLAFAANGETAGLPGLVVAEVKRPRNQRDSPFLALARAAGLHAEGFSKYCVGVSLLYPAIKHNAFNRELRIARRITGATNVLH